MDTLDITLLGKEYRVGCRPEEREALEAAVRFLEEKFIDLGAKTQASGEKLAVMTALNVAHEYLQFQRSGGFDMPGLKRRIDSMSSRLDEVLAQQEKLF
ncbi:cell division protein ZapA [Nitrogeniibacter mangrovi]|uniref:Cell division protein ZapA n=1 Tax=Nitrogeniibacter mangrovi TaxID=2016596 RepID=A0A6C1B9Y2_9RHOO|nr:cell division protein ZapA [Nitrogeniibacter mangrovi]QID19180.1 cell division protein ZapA [Nitrogeniibacter mangrovi]